MVFTPPHVLNARSWNGLRIGLFGGTFNPPHAGHLHVCHTALRTGQFDFIWWIVSPQNPLKRNQNITRFDDRLRWSQEINNHPKIIVTDIERQLATYKSIDTIRALKKSFPKTDFTFIAGTDNAIHFHQWEEWQHLLKEIKFLFIARPPTLNLIKNCPIKLYHSRNATWIYNTKLVHKSSTQIRKNA